MSWTLPEPWLSITSTLWLVVSLFSAAAALHAFAPWRKNLWFIIGFFGSWLTIELATHHLVLILIGAALFALVGGWSNPIGIAALVLNAAAITMLWLHHRGGRKAARTMKDVLKGYAEEGAWPRIPTTKLLQPFAPARREVVRIRDVEFGRAAGQRLKLDVFMPREKSERPRPVVLQIHGGAWIVGDKREQGLPLLYHLAANGWVGFNVNYRLSPAATFPDHLVDIKRALAWIREHADEYGVDPNFVAVTGGSAGGHLASLMALTANDPEYQPGFEDADTSVQAAVPLYAVYDFCDRLRLMGRPFRQRILEPWVMKRFYDDEPDAFRKASPLDRIHPDAPPFLIIHGDRDVLAPVQYARLFAKELAATSESQTLYAEMRGAQHAFDVFASPRTVRVIAGIERFLSATRERQQRGESANATPQENKPSTEG